MSSVGDILKKIAVNFHTELLHSASVEELGTVVLPAKRGFFLPTVAK